MSWKQNIEPLEKWITESFFVNVRDKNVLKYLLYFLEVTAPEDITFSSTIQTFFPYVSRILAAKLTYKYSRIRSDMILKKLSPSVVLK